MRAQRAPRRDVASCVGVGNERLRSRPSRAIAENDRRAWTDAVSYSNGVGRVRGKSRGCNGTGRRWNAVPANILEPERRSGKYRWPQVER